MHNPVVELRRELVTAHRERDQARKDRDHALNQWTAQRTHHLNQLRDLRKRERTLTQLITNYINGEMDEKQATDELEKAAGG